MVTSDAAAALEAEAVEVVGQLAAVADASAAKNKIRKHGGGAAAVDGVRGRARRNDESHGDRLHAGHFFAQQGQSIFKSVLEIPFGQCAAPFCKIQGN